MAKFDLKEYARLGAEARVATLHAELEEIYRTFPALRSRGGRRPAADAGSGPVARAAKSTRRRKPMTAAQRREVSQRMKKYWAGRRKEKA